MQRKIASFKRAVWSYYRANRRDMPWRRDTSPYAIVVSEIMLQQTQVSRVIPKFESWIKHFPDWRALAKATTKDVLREWSGLGYNRRALYLKRIADIVVNREHGIFAKNLVESSAARLPGIGPNTAGAILAYAFNEPQPFIETNIRSAYIHFFFPKSRAKIPDTKIMPLIKATLADRYIRTHVREWHWALMDYGSYIKSTHPNPSRKSAHHVRQSVFMGSNRELRSAIVRLILKKPASAKDIIAAFPAHSANRIEKNLAALIAEGFLVKRGGCYTIA